MNAVDRANYVHDAADAYFDSPQLRIYTFHPFNYEVLTLFS